MDRQDAKPRRPSLLAGAPRHVAPGPSSARILADLDGGKSVTTPPRPHRWREVLAVLALVAFGLLGANGWSPSQHGRAGAPAIDGSSDRSALTARDDPVAGTATIIDESPAPALDSPVGADAGTNPPTIPTTDDSAASPFAGTAAATAADSTAPASTENPFVTRSPPAVARDKPATQAPRLPATKAARLDDSHEPDLIATLLHNIQAQAAEPSSGLDILIRKMEATEATAAGKHGRDPLADASPRSQQIQANLRECPPPNTASGLTCRQAICVVYAGRDPACPAP